MVKTLISEIQFIINQAVSNTRASFQVNATVDKNLH